MSFYVYAARSMILCAVAIFAVPVSFAESADQAQEQNQETDLAQLQKDWATAVDSLMDYSADQRDAAVVKAGETLEQMDEQLAVLERRTAEEWQEMSVEAREARTLGMRKLEEKRRELAEWYGGMKHSSVQAWGEVKEGFVDAYKTMAEAWDEAVADPEE